MSTLSEKTLQEVIQERKSVRVYDDTVTIPREELEDMLREAMLAPSSSNLQPWRFIVIDDKETQKELREIANNQAQVETSSAVIAVLGDTEAYKNVEKIYSQSFEAGLVDEANMKRLVEGTNQLYPKLPDSVRQNIANFDAGLVSMQLMLIAKARGYDTVPMGGFDKAKFSQKFNLANNEFPIVLIAIGKAAAPAFQTTRLPLDATVRFA
ncbi:nitroreductase family protein [Peribacillus sp. SCS-155]|uniref:nitroreductase family protein n=1 Tax=Peribacillus sedimenti TaxID=3115297 RepID=UPI00390615A8